jgi:hypothetical protein
MLTLKDRQDIRAEQFGRELSKLMPNVSGRYSRQQVTIARRRARKAAAAIIAEIEARQP